MPNSAEPLELGMWKWPTDRPETYVHITHEMFLSWSKRSDDDDDDI
jgi:hypothetical protein